MIHSRTRVTVRAILAVLTVCWIWRINEFVPEPYLDEVFHVGQVQTYWKGKWREWDPKITTPPGLYIMSYLAFAVPVLLSSPKVLGTFLRGNVAALSPPIGVTSWRWTNAILNGHIMPSVLWNFYGSRLRSLGGQWAGDPHVEQSVDHTILNICLFPVLFFFSGLYYTDVLALLMVLYHFGEEFGSIGSDTPRALSLLILLPTALFALLVRQTNIFWVAVFCGGLQVVRTIQLTTDNGQSWMTWDPPASTAALNGKDPMLAQQRHFRTSDNGLLDYVYCFYVLAAKGLFNTRKIVPVLLPYLAIISVFGAFIIWNGGVVLGKMMRPGSPG